MEGGAKPIPFPVKVQQGTSRADQLGGKEPDKPPATRKRKPPLPKNGTDHILGKIGRAEWRRVLKLQEHTGWIDERDRMVLSLYCWYWERWIETPGSMKAADVTQMRLLAESLGLSAPGRGRLRGGGD